MRGVRERKRQKESSESRLPIQIDSFNIGIYICAFWTAKLVRIFVLCAKLKKKIRQFTIFLYLLKLCWRAQSRLPRRHTVWMRAIAIGLWYPKPSTFKRPAQIKFSLIGWCHIYTFIFPRDFSDLYCRNRYFIPLLDTRSMDMSSICSFYYFFGICLGKFRWLYDKTVNRVDGRDADRYEFAVCFIFIAYLAFNHFFSSSIIHVHCTYCVWSPGWIDNAL